MNRNLQELEDKIGYCFQNKKLFRQAMTHSSYANEHRLDHSFCNERLEFLGDAVLELSTSEFLYQKYQKLPEGDLTKTRASIVCEPTLALCAGEIELGEYLLLGKGEEASGGRNRSSVVSDAMEAVIAAIYLDGGLDQARRFLLPHVEQFLTDPEEQPPFRDYKTILQEIVQQNPEEKLAYVLVGESGPDHCKQFSVEVHLNSNVIGRGTGSSKKNAEQMAAKEALQLMGEG